MLVYKIFGLKSGLADGLIFNSCVSNLQSQPDLWLDECPYLYAHPSSREIDALRVELVEIQSQTTSKAPISFIGKRRRLRPWKADAGDLRQCP